MPTYVTLFNWTDQGVKNVKDTANRVEQAREAFAGSGVTISAIYWTQGRYDLIGIIEAPDDPTLAAALLRLATSGNVRTETLRAFDTQEMQAILKNIG